MLSKGANKSKYWENPFKVIQMKFLATHIAIAIATNIPQRLKTCGPGSQMFLIAIIIQLISV